MEIIKASDMLKTRFEPKFLIIGDSGGGKTTALTTLPPDWKVLVIDAFGNKESLEGSPNIEVLSYSELDPDNPTSYIAIERDREEIISQMLQPEPTWQAIALDTISGLIRFTEMYILEVHPEKKGIGGSPAQHHYRGLSHVVGQFIMGFLSLPCCVILNAHVDPLDSHEGGMICYQALISGKRWRRTIYSYVGEVYRAFGEGSDELDDKGRAKTDWFWQTQPDTMWPMLKSVMNQRSEYWGKYVEPNYAELFRRRGVIPSD